MINAMEESLQKARSTIEELIVLKKAITKSDNQIQKEQLGNIYCEKISEFNTINTIYLRRWENVFSMVDALDKLY